MQPALVFDVNETLLDLGALEPWFSEQLGPGALREWFLTLLNSSLVENHLGRHRNFTDLAMGSALTVGSVAREGPFRSRRRGPARTAANAASAP